MSLIALRGARTRAALSSADVYRAVWRWHFYAGLLVLPFLVLLSITGGIYLFRNQLDPLIHRDLMRVAPQVTAPQPPAALVAAALAVHPGTAFRYTPPSGRDVSAEVALKGPEGVRRLVYVDPYDARVLGTLDDKGSAMWIVRRLHSLALVGTPGRVLIEIAGGWTILLVATGMYLWWPRRSRPAGGVVSVRGRPRQRVFWRDLHAVTGVFVGGVLVFLAVTGMPWSVVWGDYANRWANGHNFGYPAGVRVGVPVSDEHLGHAAPTTWSLEQARVPLSTGGGAHSIGLDAAVAAFDRLGLAPGYAIALPSGPTGVYTGSVYPNDLARQRVVHLDQYSGRPVLDMGYADYGPLGRALEWGINVHMGQQWGWANQIVLLLVCVATVMMAASAAVMWWKRRPGRELGVPPMPADPRALRVIVALLAVGGVLFPLVGLSLLAMLAVDLLVVRRFEARPA